MPEYTARFKVGQSAPYRTFTAKDNADFYQQLAEYERTTTLKHIPGTITYSIMETYEVPEPVPHEELALLQLMQPGGA